ncbi:RNA-guided endonuclease TnpB family protein [Halorubrum aethiopicum]|uniref:RNA-guided endonuclease TnpB family protein n=1 Tax=Halorubrum aethiopicum TaxID=1758255 RepID=UPI00082EE652|nr:RNA-guided endonuclease TnpB family protein [Halorubrum aethiopicum]
MSKAAQSSLTKFAAGTTTEEVVQTAVLDLGTSNQKTELVRDGIEEFQAMASYIGDMVPSIPEPERYPYNNVFYQLVTGEFEDRAVKASVAQNAAHHAVDMFTSHAQRGDHGDRPDLGNGSFLKLTNQDFELVENDTGYGFKASFIRYNPIWFHVNTTPHSREYLERVFDGDADTGSCVLHVTDDGDVRAHLAVKWPVEVYEPHDVSTHVGVDIGENVLYAAAAVSGDGVAGVKMESGREFRHHREQLQQKRYRLSEKGDLRGVKACRGDIERYTDHVLHTASKEVVEFARDHTPCVIVLEDLTGYRETADDPIHDWPFADLQTKIAYKATAEGIPVELINPRNTSIRCRKCGQATPEFRDGADFKCRRCGYEVHADVNAAINIGQAYPDQNQ